VPIVIGAKRESDFTDPIGILGDCHRRIERFLNALLTVATGAKGAPLSNEQQTALAASLRYFREAAPKHTADEEESLFPRLCRLDRPDLQPLLARINSLQQDHECAEKSHRQVEHLGQLWLADGRLSTQDAEHLATVLTQLAELYRRHIAMEDTEVFPFAAHALASSERHAIGAEMAARRGIFSTAAQTLTTGQGDSRIMPNA
jgi:hemerythrin-like domain-containing protein